MSLPLPPFSEALRLNQIGAGVERTLSPDAQTRARIASSLDLIELPALEATISLKPDGDGWRMEGRIRAEAVQRCGLTLEPLPLTIDEGFAIDLVETDDRDAAEVEITIDDDAPDVIEDGRVDLGVYAVEHLALALDPFPRKPGAVFEPPAAEAEASPFAVLERLKRPADGGES